MCRRKCRRKKLAWVSSVGRSPPWPWPSPRSRVRSLAPPPPSTAVTPSKLVSSTIVAFIRRLLGRTCDFLAATPHPGSACRHREILGAGTYRFTHSPRRCSAAPRPGPWVRRGPRSPPPSSRTRWGSSGRRWLALRLMLIWNVKTFTKSLIDPFATSFLYFEVSNLKMEK